MTGRRRCGAGSGDSASWSRQGLDPLQAGKGLIASSLSILDFLHMDSSLGLRSISVLGPQRAFATAAPHAPLWAAKAEEKKEA